MTINDNGHMEMTLEFKAPKFPIGTKFSYRKYGEVEVVGYHIVHNTNTGKTDVTYNVGYNFCGQEMTTEVVQVTIDKALAWRCGECGALVSPGIACPNDGSTEPVA